MNLNYTDKNRIIEWINAGKILTEEFIYKLFPVQLRPFCGNQT